MLSREQTLNYYKYFNMKLFPLSKSNTDTDSAGMAGTITPIELNDGIYLQGVRHDKNTLTPFFNSRIPVYSGTAWYRGTGGFCAGHQMDLPFSCCREMSYNAQLIRPTYGNYQARSWTDHEYFLKGRARRDGRNGYSIITPDDKEHYYMGGSAYPDFRMSLVKDKNTHLDYESRNVYGSSYNYYASENLKPMGINLTVSEPNIIASSSGSSGANIAGYGLWRLPNTTTSTGAYTVVNSLNSSYNYNGTYHWRYLGAQFIAESDDYIFFARSASYYTSSGQAYFWIDRYNKSTNTVTNMYVAGWNNGMQIPTISNSITHENNPNIEVCWFSLNGSPTVGSPSWSTTKVEVNLSDGTLNTYGHTRAHTPTSTTHYPYYHFYSGSYGPSHKTHTIVSEVGKPGITVTSGNIEASKYYRVTGDTVTYNSTSYDVGDVVQGVSGQNAYTGDGVLQTVSKKYITTLQTYQNNVIAHESGASSTYATGFTWNTELLPNSDNGTTMYNTNLTNVQYKAVDPDKQPLNAAQASAEHLYLAPLRCWCALDPYYNKLLVITDFNAAIMQINELGQWECTQRFGGKYQSGGMDSTGRLYLLKYDSPYELHMYTTDLPYQVSVTPDSNNYTFAGTTINTKLSAHATNFESNKVETNIKLKISGSAAQFTDGTDAKTITTNTTTVNEVNFNVVGGGYFKIDAEAVTS